MYKRGFTIVELIIVITVIGILTVLGTVNLTNSQINARDAERKSDIETIAIHLETFYNSGTDDSTTVGRYPSIEEMQGLANQTKTLRDIDPKALNAPGKTGTSLIPTNWIMPITIDDYYYIPLREDGIYLCITKDKACSNYILGYKSEITKDIVELNSKNRGEVIDTNRVFE